MKVISRLACVAFVCAFFAVRPAAADPIHLLYNTGVDNAGALVAAGTTADMHYPLGFPSSCCGSGLPTIVFDQNTRPGSWVAPTATAQWIGFAIFGQNASSNQLSPASFRYDTTFTLSAAEAIDPLLSLSGLVAGADPVVDIRVNNQSSGLQFLTNYSSQFHSFSILASVVDFLPGTNTLSFTLAKSGAQGVSPEGIIVDELEVTGGEVPEPASLVLLGAGLAGVARRLRRGRAAQV